MDPSLKLVRLPVYPLLPISRWLTNRASSPSVYCTLNVRFSSIPFSGTTLESSREGIFVLGPEFSL